MNELQNSIWVEKYRPQRFEDLILENKSLLINYLKNPKSLPSFIFYSSRPGTGKTSTAKLISKYLNSDIIVLNASDERGIDSVRDKINVFARALSSNPNVKRCAFFDEADGLTRQAQDSLRNIMEEYSDSCFFIFTANDVSKIIEPIQSRSKLIGFEKPNKADIYNRLEYIANAEKLSLTSKDISDIVDFYYPDMRRMINYLQERSLSKGSLDFSFEKFEVFLKHLKNKDVKSIYDMAYSGDFDMLGYNKWMFHKIFMNYNPSNFETVKQIALRLADIEKSSVLGVNIEVIFVANMLEISKLL